LLVMNEPPKPPEPILHLGLLVMNESPKPPEPILHLGLLVMNEPPFQGWGGVSV